LILVGCGEAIAQSLRSSLLCSGGLRRPRGFVVAGKAWMPAFAGMTDGAVSGVRMMFVALVL